MTILTHKGYIAEVSVDVDAGILHGEVTNARATLTFSAKTVDGLVPAFEDTIADYLDWCLERNVEPGKPYSGALTLRMDPALHRAAAERAATHKSSLNQWIIRNIECELGHRPVAISHAEIEKRLAGVHEEVVRVLGHRTVVGHDDGTPTPLWESSASPNGSRVLQ